MMIPGPRTLRSATLAVAYWAGIAGIRERARRCARILAFHGTPVRHAKVFRRAMAYLRRDFEVVPLGSLLESFQCASPALEGKVALTFDDGIRNNVHVAYPILKELGLPATFFVCPVLIDRRQW